MDSRCEPWTKSVGEEFGSENFPPASSTATVSLRDVDGPVVKSGVFVLEISSAKNVDEWIDQ